MGLVSNKLSRCSQQILIAQLAILMLSTMTAALFYSLAHAMAVALGVSLAVINTLLARRSIERASELAYRQPDLSMVPVFTGLVQRLFVFAAGFASAVIVLKLLPLPILIGFAVAQIAYLACKMR